MDREWGGLVGPRIGFISGRTSFAIAGGWAFGEMSKLHFSETETGSPAFEADLFPKQDTDLNGWFVQGDIDHQIDGGLFVNLTARYVDYGSLTLGEQKFNDGFEKLEIDRDDLQALVGLKYKFGFGR